MIKKLAVDSGQQVQAYMICRLRPAADHHFYSSLCYEYGCWADLIGGTGIAAQVGGRMWISKVEVVTFYTSMSMTSGYSGLVQK